MNIGKIVNFCFNKSTDISEAERRNVKGFILVWLSTTFIMWFYVAFSFWVYDFQTVGIFGLLFTIIHTFVPVIFRYTKSLTISGLTISLTALCFQIVFCIYNGGIYSPSAIWFTAHPVIISFFASKRLILFSVFMNLVVVLGLTLLGNYGFFPVDALPANTTQIMMITSLILLDIVIATYTIVFITSSDESQKELTKRSDLIENLMRIISHDINNALNVSMISTRVLGNHLSKKEDLEKLALIKSSNNQILEITKSVTQWMKAEDTKNILKKEIVLFSQIEDHIHQSFNLVLSNKDIDLKIEAVIDDKILIIADSAALRNQVITNLFTNAIKFSPKGGTIVFKARILGSFLEMRIIDQGIGIPPKLISSIFDPSNNISRNGTMGEKGTGFGMPIVKNLVEQMGGDINIESIERFGTTIILKIPFVTQSI